jgi:hypothetical protein
MRRRQWAQQNTTPLFGIDDPKELAVVLCFGYLKLGGELTAEQKSTLVACYQSELGSSAQAQAKFYQAVDAAFA